MNDQPENDQLTTIPPVDVTSITFRSAASTYAYNKINSLLLMQILAKVENRDLEEIRANVDKYLVQFTEEFVKLHGGV